MSKNSLEERDKLVSSVRELLVKGYSRKVVALDLGISYYKVTSLIPYTGLALMYLTDEERRLITRQRKVAASSPLSPANLSA